MADPAADSGVPPTSIARAYYVLTFGCTLAASLIWGVNTIFLLDAGLSNLEAFAANACFTAGMVLFEVPTGIVADMRGRRLSFLAGILTLIVTTLLYVLLWYLNAGFWWWAVVSMLLGLGFTFFSGATEAWVVDALGATGYAGPMERVFGRAQVATGIGMLGGSVTGGYLAQVGNLGVPFLVRAGVLAVVFALAIVLMHDIGFTRQRDVRPIAAVRQLVSDSIEYGWRVPGVRDLMLAAPWTGGVGIFAFYALQPYLLELYGDPTAYGVAGLAAAIVAGAQIAGGIAAPLLGRRSRRRISTLLMLQAASVTTLVLVGAIAAFWPVIALIAIWGLAFAASTPIRQAFINERIPSQQRATILSFDSLMSSTGGVAVQPTLGRAADVWGYPTSYLLSGAITALAFPFLVRAQRREVSPTAPDESAA